MTIEVCDLGDWGVASLLAEYDPLDDAIRVNVRVLERVRAVLGDEAAQAFIACAVAHETFHREHPAASEREAHAFARERCGVDPGSFEAVLR